jgi:hypothetical protein
MGMVILGVLMLAFISCGSLSLKQAKSVLDKTQHQTYGLHQVYCCSANEQLYALDAEH